MSHLHKSVQLRVIALALSFAAIIAAGVTVVSVAWMYRNARRAVSQSTEYTLHVAATQLAHNINEVDALADWCTVNSTVRGFAQYNFRPRTLYETVSNKYLSMYTARYIRRFLVADDSGRFLQQGTATSQTTVLTPETISALPGMAGAGDETVSWSCLVPDALLLRSSASPGIIPVVRAMRDSRGETIARVFVGVSPALITDSFKDYDLPEGCALYWMMGGEVYAVENELRPLGSFDATQAQKLSGSDLPATLDADTNVFTYGNDLVIACPVANGMYVAQTLPAHLFWQQLPGMGVPLTIALGAILLLGLWLAASLRRTIAAPIHALQDQLAAISDGDFAPNPAIEWDNELGDIGRGINALSRSVSALMDHRLQAEKQKQDLEYRMLQNQINPHFLYNTLNSIKWMATIQHAPGIAEMTTALSRLLKSVSKGNERLVPLVEEFALLNDYFTIQQYRYGGTVMLDVDYIEDEHLIHDCMIPRFTLQPLVENAIFHGIEPKGCAGQVALTVTRDKTCGDVLIALSDDGVGMTQEQIEKALREPGPEEAAAKYRYVGIWNVHRRLQYSFGEAYGLSIASEPGHGTTVTVRLPYHKEELP